MRMVKCFKECSMRELEECINKYSEDSGLVVNNASLSIDENFFLYAVVVYENDPRLT